MFVFTEQTYEEWAVAHPWVRVAFLVLCRLRILSPLLREVEREPCGFWEWLWSWLGYSFLETKTDYYVDLLYLSLTIFFLVLFYSLIVTVLRGLLLLGQSVVLNTVRKVLGFGNYIHESIMYIFRLLASTFDPGQEVAVVVPNNSVLPYNTESIRTGSTLTKYEPFSAQVSLGSMDGTKFVAHGCGVRVDIDTVDTPFIITPGHVYYGLPSSFAIRGKTNHVVVSKQTIQLGGSLVSRTLHRLDTDVVAFAVSAVEVSVVGASKARILNTVPRIGVVANVVGPTGEGSVGALTPDASAFGWLQYLGSTVSGFSGAVYVVGTGAAGIHMLGGSRNMGYSLRLAYVTLKHACQVTPEESYEWLTGIITRKKDRILVDRTWGHLDSVRVQIKGEYHIIDRKSWADAVGNLEVSDVGALEYDDSRVVPQSADLESKNSMLAMMGAGSSSSTDSNPDQIQKLQEKVAAQKKQLRIWEEKYHASIKKLKGSTHGQGGTQTPSSQ